MAYRLLVLPIAGLLLTLAADAYVGLVAPGAEGPAVLGCLAGLVLSCLWTRGGPSLTAATLALGAVSAAIVGRFASLSLSTDRSGFSSAVAAHHLAAGLLALISLSSVCVAVLYGWLVVHRQQPWPAIALAGGAVLMRADVSATYADRFPWFMAAALFLVLYTYAPNATALWSSFPAACAALLGIALSWHVPALVPSWAAGFVDPLASAVGSQSVSAPSSLSLAGPFHPSNQVVMSIRLQRPSAAPYWRGAVFDSYDGHGWSQSESLELDIPANRRLIPPPADGAGAVAADVQLRTGADELVAPGVPLRVSVPARSFFGPDSSNLLAVRPDHPLSAGAHYLVQSIPASDLPSAPVNLSSAYLQLPTESPQVASLAWKLTSRRPTELARVEALTAYLRDSGRFHYDSGVGSDPGREAVDDFLFHTRRGYCNQFATSLAVMSRVIGIPSRLVTGYATGSYSNGAFVIRARDAHSWVEVNLPGSGWLQVDPTPGFSALSTGGESQLGPNPARSLGDPLRSRAPLGLGRIPYSRIAASSSPTAPPTGRRPSRARPHRQLPLPDLIAALIALGTLAVLAYFLRPRSLRQIYASAVAGKGWSRGKIRPSETPMEYVERLSGRVQASADLRLIAELYTRDRYGGKAPEPSELAAARRAWRRLWRPSPGGRGAN